MTSPVDLRDADVARGLVVEFGHDDRLYADVVFRGSVLFRCEPEHAQLLLPVMRANATERHEALMRLMVAAFPDIARAILDGPSRKEDS